MPAGGSRRGRRDNGLVAAEYAAVGDVDPRVGEHLLDVLAGEGIAAYLLPATDLHPVTRTTSLPARPTDRLYADRTHLPTARRYLTQLRDDEARDEASGPPATGAGPVAGVGPAGGVGPTAGVGPTVDPTASPTPAGAASERRDPDRNDPGRTDPGRGDDDVDVDSAWADIVAGYDDEIDTATAPWPAVENVPARGHDDTDPDLRIDIDLDGADPRHVDDVDEDEDSNGRRRDAARDLGDSTDPRSARRDPDEPTLLDALDTFGAELPESDTEGYTPPPAPPVPRPPAAVVLAVVSIVCGLVFFFRPDVMSIPYNTAMFIGFGLILLGVVALIWRLRPGDEDDDEDDGAVV